MRPKSDKDNLVFVLWAIVILIALIVAPFAIAQTTYPNMPISCARADGLQANAAACTDAEQKQQPANPNDVVLSCASATCDWYAADLQWRKFSAVPTNYFVVVCPAASALGPMNCPGAASPVWGGLAYVPKAQVTVATAPAPSPILPPLTSGETYIVTWLPPTTNTDGSPIGTIQATYIQASTSQSFDTYYQWQANSPTATRVEVNNGPLGTLYWRARVQVGGVFSDYSATAMTIRQYATLTKPICWPKPIGTGTWVKGSQNSTGWALYWQCTANGQASHSGAIGRWDQMAPDWVSQLASAVAGGESAFDTLWTANAGHAADNSAIQPLYQAMKDANPLPASIYVVSPNGTQSSRPASAIVNGSRTSTVVGRVGVGMPCDCTKFKSGTGSTMYCSVEGQANVATAAIDVLPASAAICRIP